MTMMAARSRNSLCLVHILCFLFATMSGGGASSRNSHAAAFAASAPAGDGSNLSANDSNTVPLLPAADPDSKLPSLKFGETMSFEELGPIILNVDGTTRRISNWDQLSPQEQQTSWRRIKKRNEERRQKILQEQLQQAEEALKKVGEL